MKKILSLMLSLSFFLPLSADKDKKVECQPTLFEALEQLIEESSEKAPQELQAKHEQKDPQQNELKKASHKEEVSSQNQED